MSCARRKSATKVLNHRVGLFLPPQRGRKIGWLLFRRSPDKLCSDGFSSVVCALENFQASDPM